MPDAGAGTIDLPPRPVCESAWTNDDPIETAPGDDLLLHFLVREDVSEEERNADDVVDDAHLPLAVTDAERRLADESLAPGPAHGLDDIPRAGGDDRGPPREEQDGEDGHAQLDEQRRRPRKARHANDDLARDDHE